MSKSDDNKEEKAVEKDTKQTLDIEVKDLENSLVEITGEISSEVFEKYREDAIQRFAEKTNIDGFRKGHIPENVLENKFGQIAILEEMAKKAIAVQYPKILQDHKIDAIGQPELTLTKLAKGSPLGFKIKTAILPAFPLPDYRKIAGESLAEKNEINVTEEEVEQVITTIRKQRKKTKEADENIEKNTKDPSASNEEKEESDNRSKTEQSKESDGQESDKEENLPELTDEVAKELGFDGLRDLKKIIRGNLTEEKEMKEKDRRRGAVIDALIEKTALSLPNIVVENELDRMMAQLKGEITGMGLEFEKYLEHVGKTEADLRDASRPDAEKRAKSQLIINKIATEENIEPKKEDVEKEVRSLTEKYDDADPERARAYIEMVLTNQLVLAMLEEEGEESKKQDKKQEKKSEKDAKPKEENK